MNARNSLLAIVFCLVAALLVVPLALYGVYRAGISQGALEAELAPPQRKSVGMSLPQREPNRKLSEPGGSSSSAEDERLAKYQALVETKNQQIELQASELKKRQEEYRKLSSDYEMLVSVLEDELASVPMSDDAQEAADAAADLAADAQAPRTRQELQADLRLLRQQRDEAQRAAEAAKAQLEELRTSSTMELMAMQSSAAEAIQAERTLREVASSALVESGEAALPFLMLMLRDERPAVRSWTCGVLGGMRARAGDAVPLLGDIAASDSDQGVRDAARRALRSIRD